MPYPRYEVFKDRIGRFKFHVKSRNYQVVLTSVESFPEFSDCLDMIWLCRQNIKDDAVYNFYKTVDGKYYFIRTHNSQEIGKSPEYLSDLDRHDGLKQLKRDGRTKNIIDMTGRKEE
jgi:uncharacterized protein YegP (UPF0339 family)